jgi:hypothetical protein
MKYKRKSDGVIADMLLQDFFGKKIYYHAILYGAGKEQFTKEDIICICKVMPKELKEEWEKINA